MIEAKVVWYDKDNNRKIGKATIDPSYTFNQIKNAICEDLDMSNPERYNMKVIPRTGDTKILDILNDGCTFEIISIINEGK